MAEQSQTTIVALRERWTALPFQARFGIIALLIGALGYWAVTTVLTILPLSK